MPDTALEITRALKRHRLVVDRVFDDVFPFEMRTASSVHWTPVEIAVRAARLLAPKPDETILDVGSGIGKFCIVAAATLNARVRGVEHRAHFVEIARAAAAKLRVCVEFVHGSLECEDARAVDGIYLFNPFAENVSAPEDHLDESVELSDERFARDVAIAERFLRDARSGTRVVTYCGFGGDMPDDFSLVLRESRAGRLELWVKR
jgi:SAM-dependent methyltransferase